VNFPVPATVVMVPLTAIFRMRKFLKSTKKRLPAEAGRRGSGNGGDDTVRRHLTDAIVRAQDRPGVATPELADALGELANHHFYAGHYDISDALNQRVLAIDRQLYGPAHPKVAEDLINRGAAQHDLGGAYMGQGQYARAEALIREAVRRFTETLSAGHINTGIARIKLGRVLLRQRRYAEANAGRLSNCG
jgi:tetratricopeptide (TPR) repeat protein